MIKIFHNKIFKVCFKTIKIIFIIFLILYLSFILLEKISYSNSIFGYHIYSINSNSMKKVYKLNDVLLVKDKKKIKIGDDIAYRGNRGGLHGIVISRIVKIDKEDKKNVIYTQGVSSPTVDPSIEDKQVVGKVIYKLVSVSYINKLLKNQAGFFFIIFCPLVLLITIELLKTITDIKVEKGRLLETDRLSLTEIIKIRNRTKGKKNIENTYHDIPLIVESVNYDEDFPIKEKDDDDKKKKKKENKKEKKQEKKKEIKKEKVSDEDESEIIEDNDLI